VVKYVGRHGVHRMGQKLDHFLNTESLLLVQHCFNELMQRILNVMTFKTSASLCIEY